MKQCPHCNGILKTHKSIWNDHEYRLCAMCNGTIEIIGTLIN